MHGSRDSRSRLWRFVGGRRCAWPASLAAWPHGGHNARRSRKADGEPDRISRPGGPRRPKGSCAAQAPRRGAGKGFAWSRLRLPTATPFSHAGRAAARPKSADRAARSDPFGVARPIMNNLKKLRSQNNYNHKIIIKSRNN